MEMLLILCVYSIIMGINTYESSILITKINAENIKGTLSVLRKVSPFELLHNASPGKYFNNVFLKLGAKLVIFISGIFGIILCSLIHEIIYTIWRDEERIVYHYSTTFDKYQLKNYKLANINLNGTEINKSDIKEDHNYKTLIIHNTAATNCRFDVTIDLEMLKKHNRSLIQIDNNYYQLDKSSNTLYDLTGQYFVGELSPEGKIINHILENKIPWKYSYIEKDETHKSKHSDQLDAISTGMKALDIVKKKKDGENTALNDALKESKDFLNEQEYNPKNIHISLLIPECEFWNDSAISNAVKNAGDELLKQLADIKYDCKLPQHVFIDEVSFIPKKDCETDKDIDNYLFNHFNSNDLHTESSFIEPIILVASNNMKNYRSTFKHLLSAVDIGCTVNDLIKIIKNRIDD